MMPFHRRFEMCPSAAHPKQQNKIKYILSFLFTECVYSLIDLFAWPRSQFVFAIHLHSETVWILAKNPTYIFHTILYLMLALDRRLKWSFFDCCELLFTNDQYSISMKHIFIIYLVLQCELDKFHRRHFSFFLAVPLIRHKHKISIHKTVQLINYTGKYWGRRRRRRNNNNNNKNTNQRKPKKKTTFRPFYETT